MPDKVLFKAALKQVPPAMVFSASYRHCDMARLVFRSNLKLSRNPNVTASCGAPEEQAKKERKKSRSSSGRTIGMGVLVIIVAVLVYLALQPPPPQPQPPASTSASNTIGRTAALDFSLKDVQGNEFRLSDFRGRVVVLEFMSTTCPHCANEAPRLASVWKRFGSAITMISTSVNNEDTNEVLKAYATAHDSPWVWAMDTGNVASAYGVSAVPAIVIIDRNGEIAYVNSGETSEETLTQQILATQEH